MSTSQSTSETPAPGTPASFAFVRAGVEDIDAIVRVGDEGRAALAALGIDQWRQGGPTRSAVTADVAAGRAHVAVPAGNLARAGAPGTGRSVAGIMALCPDGEPDYARVTAGAWLVASPDTPDAGQVRYLALHRVAVARDWRRRGVARFMFERAIERAREWGFSSVRVDTHPGNVPMQRTLESLGFVRCCEIDAVSITEPTKLRIGYEMPL